MAARKAGPTAAALHVGPADLASETPRDPTIFGKTITKDSYAAATASPAGCNRVYVAGSLTTYGTPERCAAVAEIAAGIASQGQVIILPEEQFNSNAEWLAGWPTLCRQLAHMTIVLGEDRSIGTGTFQEICDCLFVGVPVSVYERGVFWPWVSVSVSGVAISTPAVCAVVSVRGSVVDMTASTIKPVNTQGFGEA